MIDIRHPDIRSPADRRGRQRVHDHRPRAASAPRRGRLRGKRSPGSTRRRPRATTPTLLATCMRWADACERRGLSVFFAGRRSTALIHSWRPSCLRTRPNHCWRSFTHQSSSPAASSLLTPPRWVDRPGGAHLHSAESRKWSGPPGPPSVESGRSSPGVVGLEQLSSSPDWGDVDGVCSIDHRDRPVPREGFGKITQSWIAGMARQAQHIRSPTRKAGPP
jgi:hypothetical protein